MSVSSLSALPKISAWPKVVDGIPMQTRAWTHARIGLVPPDLPRHWFAVEAGGSFTALAPLFMTGGWLREAPVMFEPSDFAFSSSDDLQRLADGLARQPLPVYLERLPAGSPTLAALRQAYKRRGKILLSPAMPTPTLPLEGRGQEIDAWFNSGRRSDFRRAERLAAGFGQVSFDVYVPKTESELVPLLAEAFAMEAKSWKAATGTALTVDRAQGDFFMRFTRAAVEENMLRLAFMRIDGQAVAMQIACEWQQRFWLFKISHDLAFARCSPGQLLMRHTLGYATESGLRSYEFMGVMADWTRSWTHEVRDYVQVRAIPFSGAALKMLAKSSVRAVLRRF